MLSVKYLQRISNNSYFFLKDNLPILYGSNNPNFLHNKIISNNYKKLNQNSFEGKLCCGGTCYLLNYYLEKNKINTKMRRKSIGYGKYLEDHCFLLYNEKIIIDPTFRQFFTDRILVKNNYTDLLFNKLPFVFVGTIDDFYKMHKILSINYNDTYKNKLETEVEDFWINSIDYSELLDAKKVINNKNYAKKKGTFFLNLHNKL